MRLGITIISCILLALLMLSPSPALAAWGFGSSEVAARLDLVGGYDRNTVTTLSGRVTAVPEAYADPVSLTVQVGAERYTVVLGPRWYLQHDTLHWQVGDTVQLRGAVARDRSGNRFVLVQWITQHGGSRLVVREENGTPGWSGGSRSVSGRGGFGGAGRSRSGR